MNDVGLQKPAPRHFPVSVEMYHVMAETGAFQPTDRVELIGGEIFEMSPIGSLHARCVKFLSNYLMSLSDSEHIVGVQDPISVADDTEPQPDVSVVKFREDYYKDAHPTGADTLLVIEVADSSAEFDRAVKFPKYAAAGIPEAWLVDLTAGHVEVHSEPKESTYGIVRIYQRGEEVVSETQIDLKLQANDILG